MASSKPFEFLEKHRSKFYASLIIFLGLIAASLTYLFPHYKLLSFFQIELLLSILCLAILNYFFAEKQTWLSTQIYIMLAKNSLPKFNSSWRNTKKYFSLTYGTGLLIYLLLSLIGIIIWSKPDLFHFLKFIPNLAFPNLENFIKNHGNDNFLKTLWQIDGTVITLTFVIISFIFGLLKERGSIEANTYTFITRETHYKKIVLLNFLALIPLGIFTLVDTNGGELTILFAGASMLLFIFAILSTLHLFFKLLSLIEPSEIIKATSQAIKSVIKKTIIDEIYYRLATSTLYNTGEKSSFIGFGTDFHEELQPVRKAVTEKLIISDIKIGKIEKIAKKLTKKISNRNQKMVITRQIGSQIDPDDNIVARVNSDDYSENLQKSIASCFKTTEPSQDNDEIRELLELVRDQATSAIKKGAKSILRSSLDIFYQSLETILNIFSDLGVKFDFKSSREAFIETRSMILIQSNLRDIFDEAFKSQDRDILFDLLYFPRRLMELALDYKDHLVFKQAIYFYIYAYWAYKHYWKSPEPVVIDRIWRNVREFSDYELGRKFNNLVDTEEDTKLISGYITETLLVFNNLLKATIDNSDDLAFSEFIKALDRIFIHISRDFENGEYDIEILRNYIAREQNLREKERLESRLEISTRVNKLEKNIKISKKSIKYGIGAWLLKQIKLNKVEAQFAEKNFSYFYSQFGNIKDFSEVYFNIDKHESTSLFGWTWWESETLDEETAHSVDNSWLTEFYCVIGLRLFNTSTDNNLAAIPSEEDLEYFSSSSLNYITEEITKIIQNIRNDRAKYSAIVTDSDLEKADAFIEFHKRGVRIKLEKEEQYVRDAGLNDDAVNSFRKEFFKAWETNATVRKLFIKRTRLSIKLT